MLLAACAAQPTLPPTAPEYHVAMEAASVWPASALEAQVQAASRRYAECGINLVMHTSAMTASTMPHVTFVASLPSITGNTVEGRAYELDDRHVVEIAWADTTGTPLDHKQTLAHELAHVLGLRHTPLHSINLMSPHGCELCSFTPRQCTKLRSALKRF